MPYSMLNMEFLFKGLLVMSIGVSGLFFLAICIIGHEKKIA